MMANPATRKASQGGATEIKLALGPALAERLRAVEASLPPDGMSQAEVVRRCLRTYRRRSARGPVAIPRYTETATHDDRTILTVEDPEGLAAALPADVRVIDVLAWRLSQVASNPPHPRRLIQQPETANTGE